MGRLKTIIALIISIPVLLASQGQASSLPRSPSERVQVFATCAGRYSALVEHQRFFDGKASEASEVIRRDFEDLLDAVMPDALDWGMPGKQALNWRLTAKMAQAQLLQSAVFGSDARVSQRAHEAAQGFLSDCTQILLS